MDTLKPGEAAKYLPKLQALERDLPNDNAAEQTVRTASANLGRLLAWEAVGRDVSATEIVDARNALTFAKQEANDLHAVRGAIRDLVNEVGELAKEEASQRTAVDPRPRREFDAALAQFSRDFPRLGETKILSRARQLRDLAEKARCIPLLRQAVAERFSNGATADLLADMVGDGSRY